VKKPAAGASSGGKAPEARASQAKVDARLARIQPNEDIGRMLKSVPLLSKLSDAERAKLGGAVSEKVFTDRQRIIAQGEPGTGFFIIRRGAVAVVRTDDQGQNHELATLKDGGRRDSSTSNQQMAAPIDGDQFDHTHAHI